MKRVSPKAFTDPTADTAIANVLREENAPKRRKRLPAWVARMAQGRETVKA
ncbi:MAG: hypothetical protein ACYDCO_26570 [Armatimonadota bacterium]